MENKRTETKDKLVRTNYWIPASMLARLKKAKQQENTTIVQFMRQAIDRALKRVGL